MSQVYVELQVLHGGVVAFTRTLGSSALIAGRAPTNDLVLPDAQVSWQHALLWTDDKGTWVKDLGSSNGTFVNEVRVLGPTLVRHGDQIRLGPTQHLAIATRTRAIATRAFALEDTGSGVCIPMRSDRFRIGPDARADLRVEGAPDATLLFFADGEVRLGRDGDDEPLEPGVPFLVGRQSFRIIEVDALRAPTHTLIAERYAYTLNATLDGPTGPSALVAAPSQGLRHVISAANRATLLFLLGRQLLRDRGEGLSADDAGWCADSDVSTGVWGRGRGADPAAALHVLIHRTRQELSEVGFDPWFIEKRRRFVRVRLQEVVLTGSMSS